MRNSPVVWSPQRIVSAESFSEGLSYLIKLKTRVFFSKMSPQTSVTSESLTPFIFGGIRKCRFGYKIR